MVTDEELSVTARFKELMENTSAPGLGSIDRAAGEMGSKKNVLVYNILIRIRDVLATALLDWSRIHK